MNLYLSRPLNEHRPHKYRHVNLHSQISHRNILLLLTYTDYYILVAHNLIQIHTYPQMHIYNLTHKPISVECAYGLCAQKHQQNALHV